MPGAQVVRDAASTERSEGGDPAGTCLLASCGADPKPGGFPAWSGRLLGPDAGTTVGAACRWLGIGESTTILADPVHPADGVAALVIAASGHVRCSGSHACVTSIPIAAL